MCLVALMTKLTRCVYQRFKWLCSNFILDFIGGVSRDSSGSIHKSAEQETLALPHPTMQPSPRSSTGTEFVKTSSQFDPGLRLHSKSDTEKESPGRDSSHLASTSRNRSQKMATVDCLQVFIQSIRRFQFWCEFVSATSDRKSAQVPIHSLL